MRGRVGALPDVRPKARLAIDVASKLTEPEDRKARAYAQAAAKSFGSDPMA